MAKSRLSFLPSGLGLHRRYGGKGRSAAGAGASAGRWGGTVTAPDEGTVQGGRSRPSRGGRSQAGRSRADRVGAALEGGTQQAGREPGRSAADAAGVTGGRGYRRPGAPGGWQRRFSVEHERGLCAGLASASPAPARPTGAGQ